MNNAQEKETTPRPAAAEENFALEVNPMPDNAALGLNADFWRGAFWHAVGPAALTPAAVGRRTSGMAGTAQGRSLTVHFQADQYAELPRPGLRYRCWATDPDSGAAVGAPELMYWRRPAAESRPAGFAATAQFVAEAAAGRLHGAVDRPADDELTKVADRLNRGLSWLVREEALRIMTLTGLTPAAPSGAAGPEPPVGATVWTVAEPSDYVWTNARALGFVAQLAQLEARRVQKRELGPGWRADALRDQLRAVLQSARLTYWRGAYGFGKTWTFGDESELNAEPLPGRLVWEYYRSDEADTVVAFRERF